MRKTYLGNEGAMKMKKSIAWKYLAVCAALLTHHGTAAAQNNADESAYQAPAVTDDITDQVTDTSEPSAPASLVLSGDPRTLSDGLNRPIPRAPNAPFYPQTASTQAIEADVDADDRKSVV